MSKFLKPLIFIQLLVFCSNPILFGQGVNVARLDSLIDVLNKGDQAMGSLTVSLNNELVYSRTIGFSHAVNGISVGSTAATKYRIGSLTTMFTAVMIFQLVEENKISLKNKLVEYFPNIPNSHLITIKDLLYHRSGIYDFTADSTYDEWRRIPKTHEEILNLLYAKLPDFEPGSKAAYNISNYVILGYIIEKIEQKSYSEALKQRISSKIDLMNTYYGGITNVDDNECYSFFNISKWYLYPETDMSVSHGSGAIVSTSEDLVYFIESLFGAKLLSQTSLETMLTLKDGYGMGIFQIPFNQKIAYGNGGSIDGYGSNIVYFPGEKLAVAYVSNGIVYPINEIIIGVLKICFNLNYELPQFNVIQLAEAELMQYTGSYFIQDAPLVLDVFIDEGKLFAQATGQNAFPLTPTDKDKFVFEQGGIVLEFNVQRYELKLKQDGQLFLFTKSVDKE